MTLVLAGEGVIAKSLTQKGACRKFLALTAH